MILPVQDNIRAEVHSFVLKFELKMEFEMSTKI